MHEIQGQVQEGDKVLADVTALSSFTIKVINNIFPWIPSLKKKN